MPFGDHHYLVALPLYVGLGAAIFLLSLWMLRPQKSTLILAVAYPGLWLCMLAGQNGMLSAALLGFGVVSLVRFPLSAKGAGRAGAVWGMMCYKPQLGLPLAVVALASPFRGVMVVAALGVSGALALLSLAFFGGEVWEVFLSTSSRIWGILADGRLPMDHMISVYALLWRGGASPFLAFAGQGVIAMLAFIALWRIWRRDDGRASLFLKGAALVWAILLTTPHLFQYEFPIAGLGLLLMWVEAEQRDWSWGDRFLLFVGWMAPVLLPFSLMPALFLQLMRMCLRSCPRNGGTAEAATQIISS